MLQIRPFSIEDHSAVVELWNREATKYDYKPFTEREFQDTFIDHPYFDADCIWVGCDEKGIVGFAAGCCGDDLPLGDVAGYITSVIIDTHGFSGALRCFSIAFRKKIPRTWEKTSGCIVFQPC